MSLYIRYPFNGAASGGSGGGGGITATLYDPFTTSVTSGSAIVSPFIVDGVTVTNGMTVLFSNLSTGNNEIYQASVIGTSITWSAKSVFNNSATPNSGAQVVITAGTSFSNQVGTFNGTTWLFNYSVRYFNGTDYFEQSSINTTTLADNTTNGTVFSLAYAGSQNIIVEYSILRGGAKEVGTIPITTDGTSVGISNSSSGTASTGVTFSAVISGSNLILQYTTTSTGSPGTMKYEIRRWSDTAGGPGGPPSYTGGASSIAAAGVSGNIQINGSGLLSANSNFSYDSINNLLLLGLDEQSIQLSATILDNQVSPTTVVGIPVAGYNSLFIDYTVIRGSNVKTGEILVATDGATGYSEGEEFAEFGSTGVLLSVAFSSGNILIKYTSTSTGSGGTFKFSVKRR